MKKLFLLISLIIFCILPVSSKTLTGGISFTVESARQYSFNNVQYKIDMNLYKEHFVDKNNEENKKALANNKTHYKGRYLTHYSTGDYSVNYKNNSLYVFYYNSNGTLLYIGIYKGTAYPELSYMYDINGNLDSVTLSPSNDEQYMFDLNKTLQAHWKGKNCYDEKGELVQTRTDD